MSEFRRDPISGRWVVIADPQSVHLKREETPLPDEKTCPFCPGHEDRTPPEIMAYAPGHREPNGPGWSLRVIPNRTPVLKIEGSLQKQGEGLYDRMNGIGAHEVIIEHPDHDATLSSVGEKEFEDLLWAYRERTVDLKRDDRFRYVMIFKNHGAAAGARLAHGHSQLIALPVTPRHVTEEIQGAEKYFSYRDRCVFCDLIRQELDSGVRLVTENETFICIAPYASRAPFEVWLLPREHAACFEDNAREQCLSMARIFSDLLRRLDTALEHPAYNFTLHTSPFRIGANPYYHWHFEITPRLFTMAGFEWGSGFFINPTPPEDAAKYLREMVSL